MQPSNRPSSPQVASYLHTLLAGHGAAEQKKANNWLEHFQRSEHSLEVSLELLDSACASGNWPALIFGAQTVLKCLERSKCGPSLESVAGASADLSRRLAGLCRLLFDSGEGGGKAAIPQLCLSVVALHARFLGLPGLLGDALGALSPFVERSAPLSRLLENFETVFAMEILAAAPEQVVCKRQTLEGEGRANAMASLCEACAPAVQTITALMHSAMEEPASSRVRALCAEATGRQLLAWLAAVGDSSALAAFLRSESLTLFFRVEVERGCGDFSGLVCSDFLRTLLSFVRGALGGVSSQSPGLGGVWLGAMAHFVGPFSRLVRGGGLRPVPMRRISGLLVETFASQIIAVLLADGRAEAEEADLWLRRKGGTRGGETVEREKKKNSAVQTAGSVLRGAAIAAANRRDRKDHLQTRAGAQAEAILVSPQMPWLDFGGLSRELESVWAHDWEVQPVHGGQAVSPLSDLRGMVTGLLGCLLPTRTDFLSGSTDQDAEIGDEGGEGGGVEGAEAFEGLVCLFRTLVGLPSEGPVAVRARDRLRSPLSETTSALVQSSRMVPSRWASVSPEERESFLEFREECRDVLRSFFLPLPSPAPSQTSTAAVHQDLQASGQGSMQSGTCRVLQSAAVATGVHPADFVSRCSQEAEGALRLWEADGFGDSGGHWATVEVLTHAVSALGRGYAPLSVEGIVGHSSASASAVSPVPLLPSSGAGLGLDFCRAVEALVDMLTLNVPWQRLVEAQHTGASDGSCSSSASSTICFSGYRAVLSSLLLLCSVTLASPAKFSGGNGQSSAHSPQGLQTESGAGREAAELWTGRVRRAVALGCFSLELPSEHSLFPLVVKQDHLGAVLLMKLAASSASSPALLPEAPESENPSTQVGTEEAAADLPLSPVQRALSTSTSSFIKRLLMSHTVGETPPEEFLLSPQSLAVVASACGLTAARAATSRLVSWGCGGDAMDLRDWGLLVRSNLLWFSSTVSDIVSHGQSVEAKGGGDHVLLALRAIFSCFECAAFSSLPVFSLPNYSQTTKSLAAWPPPTLLSVGAWGMIPRLRLDLSREAEAGSARVGLQRAAEKILEECEATLLRPLCGSGTSGGQIDAANGLLLSGLVRKAATRGGAKGIALVESWLSLLSAIVGITSDVGGGEEGKWWSPVQMVRWCLKESMEILDVSLSSPSSLFGGEMKQTSVVSSALWPFRALLTCRSEGAFPSLAAPLLPEWCGMLRSLCSGILRNVALTEVGGDAVCLTVREALWTILAAERFAETFQMSEETVGALLSLLRESILCAVAAIKRAGGGAGRERLQEGHVGGCVSRGGFFPASSVDLLSFADWGLSSSSAPAGRSARETESGGGSVGSSVSVLCRGLVSTGVETLTERETEAGSLQPLGVPVQGGGISRGAVVLRSLMEGSSVGGPFPSASVRQVAACFVSLRETTGDVLFRTWLEEAIRGSPLGGTSAAVGMQNVPIDDSTGMRPSQLRFISELLEEPLGENGRMSPSAQQKWKAAIKQFCGGKKKTDR